MEIRCPQCGHKFDPMGEILVDCPCCELMIDTRTISTGSEAEQPNDNPPKTGREADAPFSVKDLRRGHGQDPRSARNAMNWEEPAPDDHEFWAARREKDVDDAVEYCGSPKWKRMSERDEQRRDGFSPGLFVLIAGLFFPGAGHFRLGRPARGAIFFVAVILAGVVTFFAVPIGEQPDFMGRGYPELPPSIYALIGSILSSKVKYALLAVGTVHFVSLVDLIVLLGIGPKPRFDSDE